MTVVLSWWRSRVRIIGTLRSFSNDDGDGNENVKKATGLLSKTTNLHVHLAFLYISLPPLQEYDVKMSNFTFYGGRKQATTNFSLSLSRNFGAVPKKSTPGKFAHFWHFKRTGINAEKFEKTRIHFLKWRFRCRRRHRCCRFDLINVLTERKNVFHLNEFSVKSENSKKFKNEQKFKLS